MRIVGGKFKGKKILQPKSKQTRPLKDLTKESIFNILNHSNKFKISIENSIVLDLFLVITPVRTEIIFFSPRVYSRAI